MPHTDISNVYLAQMVSAFPSAPSLMLRWLQAHRRAHGRYRMLMLVDNVAYRDSGKDRPEHHRSAVLFCSSHEAPYRL